MNLSSGNYRVYGFNSICSFSLLNFREKMFYSSRVTGKRMYLKKRYFKDGNQFIQNLLFAKKNKQAAKNVLDDSVIVFCIAFFTL